MKTKKVGILRKKEKIDSCLLCDVTSLMEAIAEEGICCKDGRSAKCLIFFNIDSYLTSLEIKLR